MRHSAAVCIECSQSSRDSASNGAMSFEPSNCSMATANEMLRTASMPMRLIALCTSTVPRPEGFIAAELALRTTLVFERKREKLLEEARKQREQAQHTRLERIRSQRRLEAERARKAQQAEAEQAKRT